MGEQQNPMKKYTVLALLLQVVVLLSFAAMAYNDSLVLVGSPRDSLGFSSEIFARVASLIFSALALIAIWLTGEHHTETVRKLTLTRWALICILLSFFPLIAYSGIFVLYPSIQSLASLLPVIAFLVPTILVFHFSRLESP